MIKKIAQKEWKEQVREKSFLASAIILVILFLTALFSSRAFYEKEQELRNHAQAGIEENWLNQRDKNPHGAAHYGTYLFRPESRLALIDRGVNRYAGTTFFVEGHVRNEGQFRTIEDETGLVRFGELTPAYILLYLMPLLIIVAGFNTFIREKEGGTWRMLQSHGVPLREIIAGKWIGTACTAGALFLPLFILMGMLTVLANGYGEFRMIHFLSFGAVYLLFYIIFINITLIVSWFSGSSGGAFMTLLSIWIMALLVVPKVFVSVAEYLYPLPDSNRVSEMYSEARAEGVDGHVPSSFRELEQEVMEEHGVDRLEDLPFNFAGYSLQVGEEHDTRAYNYVFSHIREQIGRQNAVIHKGSFLSPFLSIRNLSMAFAYTDVNTHWDFSEAAELYRQEFVLYLNEDLMYNSRYGETYLAGRDVWAEKPGFHYELPRTREVFAAQTANFGALFAWLGVSFFGLLTIRSNRKRR